MSGTNDTQEPALHTADRFPLQITCFFAIHVKCSILNHVGLVSHWARLSHLRTGTQRVTRPVPNTSNARATKSSWFAIHENENWNPSVS